LQKTTNFLIPEILVKLLTLEMVDKKKIEKTKYWTERF